ncbi:DUF3073 domain-containing protein [Nocardia vermiculata]|uniref:DUF3073 domain-containing protein n=1 Tax=Nocardia vermiculata TaxID=257274 RepID=A0A846Y5E5_9NOCA|nr:DUF3073 domain-containing protein [Nocardia vermiculata]NKY53140.1 DUF3073 domain-containing protein [Nocardia vermiculata]
MGRGRAKAKQTKVARELKYSSPSTDFSSLQRELSGHPPRQSSVLSEDHDSDEPLKRWEDDEDIDDWRR